MAYPENDDPTKPWNDPRYDDDPRAPWNDPRKQDDPFACWNDVVSGKGEYEDEVDKFTGRR
jgi:hypothetical protein